MNTLYTAIGRYESRSNGYGKRYPTITVGAQEFIPNTHEMVVWTCLNFNVLTIQQTTEHYIRKCNYNGLYAAETKSIIDRLIMKGLVVTGCGDTNEDALYDLLCDLNVTIPTSYGIIIKVLSFLKLTFINGVPFKEALTLLKRTKYSADEKRVIDLAKQTDLSTAEIIKCIEVGAIDISDDDKMLDVLYGDDDTTSDNIGAIAKLCRVQKRVLSDIANLYLRKQIIFQRI